jgi:hypothetical protein
MVIDKVDSLPSRFKKLSIGKKRKGGALKKKLLSGLEENLQNLIIKKSSKKRTGRKASSKNLRGKAPQVKEAQRGTSYKKEPQKQSFKALKFNF